MHYQSDVHPDLANLCKRLRYLLGGYRPSQTTHQILSLSRFHGSKLELKQHKGGISLLPRRAPTYAEQVKS